MTLTHWTAATAVTLVLERLDGCMRLLRFGIVVSQSLNVIQISVVHPASDVFTGEDGTFVFLDRGVELRTRLDEIGKRLEDDQVGSNLGSDLFDVSVVSDELLSRWHVDTVHVGVSEWTSANKVDAVRLGTNLMGGAAEAKMTFLAPTSRAIWMISLEVVPRTIESIFWSAPEMTTASSVLTIDQHDDLVGELHGHGIELPPDVLSSTLAVS